MDYTKKVSEFVAQTTYGSLPAKAIELAKQAILDSVAVTLAGSVEPAGKICAQIAREESTSRAFSDRVSEPLLLRLLLLTGQPVMRWTMTITSSTWANPRPVWLRPLLRFQKSWKKTGGIFWKPTSLVLRSQQSWCVPFRTIQAKKVGIVLGRLGHWEPPLPVPNCFAWKSRRCERHSGSLPLWRAVSSGTMER